jgi:anti-sigma factor RsiW
MNHRHIKDWIEEYVDHTLSLEKVLEIEQHIEDCSECRERVNLTRMTRQFVRTARLEGQCAPGPRFVHSVVAAIEQQKENYLFWSPVRLLALRAIPLMALLAFILAIVAYSQFVPALSANGSEPSYVESYLDLSPAWEQEKLLFSNAATAQDSEKPANSPKDQPKEASGPVR